MIKKSITFHLQIRWFSNCVSVEHPMVLFRSGLIFFFVYVEKAIYHWDLGSPSCRCLKCNPKLHAFFRDSKKKVQKFKDYANTRKHLEGVARGLCKIFWKLLFYFRFRALKTKFQTTSKPTHFRVLFFFSAWVVEKD